MNSLSFNKRLVAVAFGLAVLAGAGALVWTGNGRAQADSGAPSAPPATPVSVARVAERDTAVWDEFSGRLEAIEQVEVRSRVAGAIQEIRFREGALVQKDDVLVVIDPALYAAEVARAEAQVAAAQARLVFTKSDYERGQQLGEFGLLLSAELVPVIHEGALTQSRDVQETAHGFADLGGEPLLFGAVRSRVLPQQGDDRVVHGAHALRPGPLPLFGVRFRPRFRQREAGYHDPIPSYWEQTAQYDA